MARVAAAQFTWIIWIFTLLGRESLSKNSVNYFMDDADNCGRTQQVDGATIYSHYGANQDIRYSDKIDCRLTFRAQNENWKLMMRVELLDIPDVSFSELCNDALYVYDAHNIFGRSIKAAGGTGGLCGDKLPPVIYSSGPYLTLFFRTDRGGPSGRGFRLVITAFSNDFERTRSCGQQFQCANEKCIHADLHCDKVNHCGDNSDELRVGTEQCGADNTLVGRFKDLGLTASIAITLGSVVIVVVCVVCVVCCCCKCLRRKRNKKRRAHDSGPCVGPHTTTATSVTINNGGPVVTALGHSQYHGYNPHPGYYAMQPVPAGSGGGSIPGGGGMGPGGGMMGGGGGVPPQQITYSPYPQARDSYPHSQGSLYSSHPPPSYHRSYTPTSSKSGRSHQSADSIVKYNHNHDKVALPVHL